MRRTWMWMLCLAVFATIGAPGCNELKARLAEIQRDTPDAKVYLTDTDDPPDGVPDTVLVDYGDGKPVEDSIATSALQQSKSADEQIGQTIDEGGNLIATLCGLPVVATIAGFIGKKWGAIKPTQRLQAKTATMKDMVQSVQQYRDGLDETQLAAMNQVLRASQQATTAEEIRKIKE